MIRTMKLTTIATLLSASILSAATGMDTLVKIDSGWILGTGTSVRSYKGIPYAAPPTGDLRWKPPQPPKPWKDIRVANNFSPICPQIPLVPGPQSEDCLTLNVWTPPHSASEKLPVMVWIHGGGFQIGASSQTAYDGERLASQGIVLVSINYRMGVFGFLSHPALDQESPRGVSGNYGLLDMVAALEWVKRNIPAFGGDPGNVTIFGESAGGTAVCFLMVMPQAQGLFNKVISESAAWMYMPISYLKEPRYGRVAAEKFGEKLGPDIAALRSKSTGEIMKLVGMPDVSGEASDRGEAYMPVVDGWVLSDEPGNLFSSGKFQGSALIAGTNADEGTLLGGPKVKDKASLQKWAEKQFHDHAGTVLEAYPAATDQDAYAASAQASGDWTFLQGTRSVLRTVSKVDPKTYQYQFTRINGVGRRIKWGSFHASEVAYVFGTLPDSVYGTQRIILGDFSIDPDTYNTQDEKLSNAMQSAWIQFAKKGDPNGPGLPHWPAFTGAKESYLEFGDQIAAKSGLRKKQLDALTDISTALREHSAGTQ